MPIYAYRCEACGLAKDVLQKISDATLTDCDACGAPAMKKQVTAAGFQLKGSGWYVTDFRSNGSAADHTPGAGSGADAVAPSAGSSAGASESASPAESKPAESKPPAQAAS